MSQIKTSFFKTYDVRGKVSSELTEDIVYTISRAYAVCIKAKSVVVGHDSRESSKLFSAACIKGLIDENVKVLDLGLCGTEEMYHAAGYFEADGGIEITASHNPIEYNGMKLVGKRAEPLDVETQFAQIKNIFKANKFQDKNKGSYDFIGVKARELFVDKVLSFINLKNLKPMKILVNCGNGAVGPTFKSVQDALKKNNVDIDFIYENFLPDGSFPNGIPNPMLKSNQVITQNLVLANNADLGLAFDGDFDRCFFFDEKGNYIDGEYIVGILAEIFSKRELGAKIVHDPRSVWNILELIEINEAKPIMSKTGHVFVKQAMRKNNAIYGGEISAHHYFRDFFYCDSGMIPWLLICELLSCTKKSLSNLVDDRRIRFPSSGEKNFRLKNPQMAMENLVENYCNKSLSIDYIDGISMTFESWRFNVRKSNTENVVRLNVETKLDRSFLLSKLAELTKFLEKFELETSSETSELVKVL